MTIRRGRRVAIAAGAAALVVMILAVWLGWPHLVFWYRFETLGVNAQGFREYRHRQTGIVMVLLPGGKFWMGAQRTDPDGQNYDLVADDDAGPVHEVILSPFLIGKHEVTQAQWRAAMGSNPSKFTGDDDRPVEQVSWEDIQLFERKTGLRLPTEARWEYACRGGSTTPIAGTGNLDDMGWYGENSGETTHPVGKKAANGFGLFDMHGNVWEWVEDAYEEGFYRKPEAWEPDPVSVTGSRYRVVRGGGGGINALYCRAWGRLRSPPGERGCFLGCRPTYPPP
jgi:formylglycine-generating enzyme required for sulfatase activity